MAAALAAGGVVAARALAPRVHARMLAACEGMFAEMPDGFPPKRMLRGIEETRANSARILELLERREHVPPPARTDEVEVAVA